MFDLIGKVASGVVNTAVDAVTDPVGTVVRGVTQPIVDGCDLLEGLTEGEFRAKAAIRLGTSQVDNMAIEEVIKAMTETK